MVRTEPEGNPGAQIGSDEIDLGELFRTLWAGRWMIALVALGMLVLAGIYLRVATYRHTAELFLTPAQSGGSSRLGGLGGLASFAGINLPQDSGELSFALYQQGVHSRGLAEALSRHPDLMRTIFAAEWNAETGQWEKPEGFVSSAITSLKNVLGVPVYDWRPPDAGRLQVFLQQEVEVTEDMKNPFVTVTFRHENPAFAVHFLTILNSELDSILRRKALERSTGNIAYLSEQLGKVTIAEHREAIAQALTEQEKERMAASSSAPYAADPFGAPSASVRPTSPRPTLVLAASLVMGGILGTLLVLVRGSGILSGSAGFGKEESDSLSPSEGDRDHLNAGAGR